MGRSAVGPKETILLFSQLQFWVFFAIVFASLSGLAAPRPEPDASCCQLRLLRRMGLALFGPDSVFHLGVIISSVCGWGRDGRRSPQADALDITHDKSGPSGFLQIFEFLRRQYGRAAWRGRLSSIPLVLSIMLPVGISFYTFQTLSYTIDVYRRELEAVP